MGLGDHFRAEGNGRLLQRSERTRRDSVTALPL